MRFIDTPKAPLAIGPYSQAIVAAGTLYVSGQIALSPETGQLVGSTAREQVVQCLSNLAAILEASGVTIHSLLKVTLYLVSMDDFAAVNEVYGAWLGAHRPARVTVAVSALPRGALVEVDCIASLVA